MAVYYGEKHLQIGTILKLGSWMLSACRVQVGAYILLYLLTHIIPLIIAVVLANLTNSIGANPHTSELSFFKWLGLTLCLVPLTIGFRLMLSEVNGQMSQKLRGALLEKVIRQDPEFFRIHSAGELTNVLSQSALEAQQAIRSLIVDPILELITLGLGLWLLKGQMKSATESHPAYAWVILAIVVSVGILSAWLTPLSSGKAVSRLQIKALSHYDALAGIAGSAILSPQEIQTMGAESMFTAKYVRELRALLTTQRAQLLGMEGLNAMILLPSQVIVASLYGFLVYQSRNGGAYSLPGTIPSIALLVPQLMQPFTSFAVLGVTAHSAWPSISRIVNILNAGRQHNEMTGAQNLEISAPTLEVKQVAFTYPYSKTPVFVDLNLSVAPAKITGLVARSGEGKTTLFRLMLGFYVPQHGQILLGGHQESLFATAGLRRHVGMMSQFPAFFHDTVRENFLIAKQDATDEEIRALCVSTGIWEILERSAGPNPLDLEFKGGEILSGGEKKLFAMTRCLLRKPSFLFLDEPSAGMDNEKKYSLIPLMRSVCVGKTVIVVEHDIPWLIQFCDEVAELEGGRIIRQGTPTKLLRESGLLKDLYELACPSVGMN